MWQHLRDAAVVEGFAYGFEWSGSSRKARNAAAHVVLEEKTEDVPGYKTCSQGEYRDFGAGNLLLLLDIIAYAGSLLKRELV